MELIRYIQGKTNVSTVMLTDAFAIDKHFTAVHHTFKLHKDLFPSIMIREFEITPIPAYSIVDSIATVVLLLKLHHMWQYCWDPFGVIQTNTLATFKITTIKGPIRV
ncbi:hypothetical protein D3C81_1421270 [compost metagenome]